ncbi:CHAT domain-containing protein [Azospirillum argentinense]|uniref:CHAT domain-containing protein n=1 Tax=Azospirillum argentinense TaxID=2970906 RepID=A0A5B0KKV6_9PROT|nr:CHAT domain-containing protein [Azospirillum argentinense]KAA1052481.1 hypothetical protein FH063_004258 [Azospirillum argentinense]
MKVLYVATKGESATDLSPDLEIDKLRRCFAGSVVDFAAIPNISAEELPAELSNREFDVLHIAAHGTGGALEVRSVRGTVLAHPEQIATFLLPSRLPRLVYLNACDSAGVAEALVHRVPFAIGTTAPVASDYAIHTALSFYLRLLLGGSVAEAAEVARSALGMFSSLRADIKLFAKAGEDPERTRLVASPEILVSLPSGYKLGDDVVEINFGVRGVPEGTLQVVFFSDDEDLLNDGKQTLAAQLCAVTRRRPTRDGEVWCDRSESWDVGGDFRLFAVGVTADGRRWTVTSHLCDALRRWYDACEPMAKSRVRKKTFDALIRNLEAWVRR